MSKLLPNGFDKMPFSERRKWLEANADKTAKDKTVFKDLSPQQMDELETEIATTATDLSDEEAAYKEVQAEYRERIKEFRQDLDLLIQKRRTGQEEITTDIYYIADQDNGRMYGYAPDGVEVENRRLTEEERQTTIHSMGRAN